MPSQAVISFRPPDDLMHMKLEQLRSTFPQQRWSEVFCWLLEQPEVREVIRKKVTE